MRRKEKKPCLMMDTNGNKVLYPWRIQTNGNLPTIHREPLGFLTLNNEMVNEINTYLDEVAR